MAKDARGNFNLFVLLRLHIKVFLEALDLDGGDVDFVVHGDLLSCRVVRALTLYSTKMAVGHIFFSLYHIFLLCAKLLFVVRCNFSKTVLY
jgi:hypothetical protein